MILDKAAQIPVSIWLLAAFCSLSGWLARIRYRPVLRKFDGPFLASFTDAYRLWQLYRYPDRVNYVGLDEKYGDIIRLGPRTLVFARPDAIKEIYTTGFRKVLDLEPKKP
jgi:hypothetical protein